MISEWLSVMMLDHCGQVVLWSTDPSGRLPLLQWRHHEKMNWLPA
jgi:hypothetical protein